MTEIATKHTPKPWAINPMVVQIDAMNGDGYIVPVCQMLWPTDERSEAETYANARLIAAAPDLLDALKDIVASYESYRAAEGDDDTSDSIELAEAAIRLAETGAR
ncbi:hypothetical protein [Enterovirga aerilata]|uniref:Uncharacterized protein n=1 Tax=Enterovirga aerilata TaxID=2730920 RepID=A0A849ICL5_9HYPH|nr:hypothetical protein [Enterovirga sp. DB1703]NNM75011.1 hypothetical protein [Enterovirga sp. DB1703]